jgi:hypothetical protein
MKVKYMTRGALVGAAILPAYWLASMPTVNEAFIAPAALGIVLLGLVGAIAGYCWSNVAGLFDFSLPTGFLARSNVASEASTSGHSDVGGFDWDEHRSADPFRPRRQVDEDLKERFIVSGDWRDEFSSPSSREEDDRHSGLR